MTAQVHSLEKAKGRRSITVESDPNMCAAMIRRQCLVIRSAMTTNGSKDVLGSYANCTETRRRVRYKLFCSNNAQTCNLPPTKDALKYHVARANYQACIWQNSLEAAAHTPSPHGHGWDVIDGHISIHWMDQQPAPKTLLQFISCNCLKGHCVGGRCSCRKNVMSCTDACGCVECSNTQDISLTENDSRGEDED